MLYSGAGEQGEDAAKSVPPPHPPQPCEVFGLGRTGSGGVGWQSVATQTHSELAASNAQTVTVHFPNPQADKGAQTVWSPSRAGTARATAMVETQRRIITNIRTLARIRRRKDADAG